MHSRGRLIGPFVHKRTVAVNRTIFHIAYEYVVNATYFFDYTLHVKIHFSINPVGLIRRNTLYVLLLI